MLGIGDLAGLDPAVPAPPLLLDLHTASDTARDAAGDLAGGVGGVGVSPLVGGQRNFVFEVALEGGRRLACADDAAGILSLIIPGYQAVLEGLGAAEALGDRSRVQARWNELFALRAAHARWVRMVLQDEINQVARLLGSWESLTPVEQGMCVAAAEGGVPVGIRVDEPFTDPDGCEVLVPVGVWSAPDVALVIDRGDYGLFDPDGVAEPESTLPDSSSGPANLVVLDSTDDDAYLASLDHAGWVDVATHTPEPH